MERNFTLFWRSLLPALAVVLCSCGTVHTQLNRGSAGASPAAEDREHALVKADNGKTELAVLDTGDKARYPGGIPFAQYPGSKVTLCMTVPGISDRSVRLETDDSPDKALSYYRKWFQDNGWHVAQQSLTSGLAAITAERGNDLVSIMSAPDTGATGKNNIQITVSNK